MVKYQERIEEGKLYFDEVVESLQMFNCPLVISVLEDGTKVTEAVEYEASNNILVGLVSPTNGFSGMPERNFFKAFKALDIVHAIEYYSKAKYVQVILVKPDKVGKKL